MARLNKRQKLILFKLLVAEWEKQEWLRFNVSMTPRGERKGNFEKNWNLLVQEGADIEKMLYMYGSEIDKRVYWEPVKVKVKKEMDEEYHRIMSER